MLQQPIQLGDKAPRRPGDRLSFTLTRALDGRDVVVCWRAQDPQETAEEDLVTIQRVIAEALLELRGGRPVASGETSWRREE